jgi:hypothetical protein
MGYDPVIPALGLEVIMTLQHVSHPRMVFTYALDTAFQDIGVAAILGILLVCLREEFRFFGIFSHFVRGSTAFSTWGPGACLFFPSHHIFLACTFVDFALLRFFSSRALLPVSGHLCYASGLEQDILNSF